MEISIQNTARFNDNATRTRLTMANYVPGPDMSDYTVEQAIHSITGATQTCVRLEKLINDGLAQWQEGLR